MPNLNSDRVTKIVNSCFGKSVLEGDALVYGCSLYVIRKEKKAQPRSALLKGGMMFITAIAVFARASYQLFAQSVGKVLTQARAELI